jgi:acyl-CoA synthetase (NDP forming)
MSIPGTPLLSTLDTLFNPTSVAIVGASEDRDRLSGRPQRYLMEAGFKGVIYPVNPNRSTVQGLPACRRVAQLPATPDLALIVVPVASARQAVVDCANRGIRSIYLLTGGFAESGEEGRALQGEIGEIARAHGIRLLGPNCLGAFNAHSRFFGAFGTSLERGFPAAGPVAIASQSGAYGQHLAYLLHRRGVGMSYFMSTGNELDVELSECIEWLAVQPQVGVILAYAEGVRDGARLARALEAARLARKPVVFYKVGASAAGSQAAASHTAAMAGTDEIYDGVFRQFGVHRARSIEEQLDIAYACARSRPLRGGRLGIVSVSGGGGVQMADSAEAHGLLVPALSPPVQAELRAIIPMGGHANPVDTTGQVVNKPQLLAETLQVVADAGECDALAVFLGTVPLTSAGDAPLREAIRQGTERFRTDGAVAVSMVADEPSIRAAEAQGCLVYEDPARAVRALGALNGFARAFAAERSPPAAMSIPAGVGDRALSEVEAKALLRSAGLATLPEVLARSADEAVCAAAEFAAPVAMKVVSPQILHKTEIGGVLLGVSGDSAVRDGYMTLNARAARAYPDLALDGILVSPMAPRGVEVILGAVYDPTFGPVVMLGFGGVTAELFRDTAFRAAPLDEAEALRMIEETHVWRMLQGWRGAPPGDVPALVRAVCAVSRLALGLGEALESIDINPLLVLEEGKGAVVLDALVHFAAGLPVGFSAAMGGDLSPPSVWEGRAEQPKLDVG